jgi:DNA ligase D-like protein (predicted ligase)
MSLPDPLAGEDADAMPEEATPDFRDPALAVLTHAPFDDPGWIAERKLDGERVIAVLKDGRARLFSRNRKALDATYPELVEALTRRFAHDAVLDGEVVAFDGAVTSFARLQKRMQVKDPEAARASGVRVHLYLFDVMHLAGRDLRPLPLRRRKAVLRASGDFGGCVRFVPHRNTGALAWLREACAKGWEGLIAKRADAPYPDGRSRDWLKFKCEAGQELVIGGFTAPQGARTGFGALLVGHFDGDALIYAGKVGTGFDEATLADLHERMSALARDDPPFADPPPDDAITWVEPELVAEIGFTEWTEDGKLRHPRYLGLRRDKAPKDVVREDAG